MSLGSPVCVGWGRRAGSGEGRVHRRCVRTYVAKQQAEIRGPSVRVSRRENMSEREAREARDETSREIDGDRWPDVSVRTRSGRPTPEGDATSEGRCKATMRVKDENERAGEQLQTTTRHTTPYPPTSESTRSPSSLNTYLHRHPASCDTTPRPATRPRHGSFA